MHIYLETAPGSGVFNYRGKAGENDDPDSFAKKMGQNGFRVLQKDEFAGLEIDINEEQ